jgi:Protein of unknown function (DUF2804)
VGIYGERVMLCAAAVQIGPLRQWFWAAWDREVGALHEATRFVPGSVALPGGGVRLRGRGLRADLVFEPAADAVEVCSAHGDAHIWTRKMPIRARGTVLTGARAVEVDARGLVDESAGYHARRTAWSWSAGAGVTADGRDVWWNLVAGVHDAAAASERAVWISDGTVAEPGPVTFAPDLATVTGEDGAVLSFALEAERARDDDLVVFASRYRQPFGAFTGTLPGGVALASGLGVVERHDVRW